MDMLLNQQRQETPLFQHRGDLLVRVVHQPRISPLKDPARLHRLPDSVRAVHPFVRPCWYVRISHRLKNRLHTCSRAPTSFTPQLSSTSLISQLNLLVRVGIPCASHQVSLDHSLLSGHDPAKTDQSHIYIHRRYIMMVGSDIPKALQK